MNKNTLIETIKDAYIYGYPIVGMYELLYTQVINPETKTTNFNEFLHTATVASPKTSFIPAPNNDTTYSRAWIDLRKEPVIIETPDTDDRYYSIQLLNLFSETITNVGRRTTGTKKNTFALVGPTWDGNIPNNIKVIKSDTTFALAFLRVLINDENDLAVVKDLQNQFTIKPLSSYLSDTAKLRNSIENLPQYKNSNYYEFFETLNNTLSLTPKLNQETNILSKLIEIGVGANLSSKDINSISEEIINSTCDEAKVLIDKGGMAFGETDNFWRIARHGIGNYGTDYLQRSVVWFKGALANQPTESLYPSTFQDSTGELLDGNFDYVLKFNKENLPPVSEFWSLTMYHFNTAFLVENKVDRYSIGDRSKDLIYEDDGSLTIYIQKDAPKESSKESNWLPAPSEKFYMTLRLYGPSSDAISGKWSPPSVEKLSN